MAKIFSKLIKANSKAKTIDVAVNNYIETKKLKAQDISNIYFSSDLASAIICHHVDDDAKIKVVDDEPEE